MEKALDVLMMIEDCTKKMLEIIKNEQFEQLPTVLDERSDLISRLDKAKSADTVHEKSVLHRIEKTETKMLELLKNSTSTTKDSIDTVSKGKRAVQNGYFKSKMTYEKNNRFLKRG